MRDTPYAKELATATIAFNSSDEGKMERILVKESEQEEIRFSWWKDGRIMMRPLDLGEDSLIELFKSAIAANVFTPKFRAQLRGIL